MCLGIPGEVIELLDRPDLAKVNVSGVRRAINIGLLENENVQPGDWILIHVGFALSKIDEDEAAAALAFLEGIGTAYTTHPDGYRNSAELVAGIKRQHGDIEISVSAYPEKHPESPDFDADIDFLKAKVDAGAARAITQVFFDNDLYFRYLDRVRARGIDIPIVPGIMPMHNFKQARNFVTRAGTSVPNWLAEKFEGLDDDPETRKLVAATVAAGQVQKLAKHGVDTFHFYTMNRADLVFAISHLLGIRPNGAQKAA